MQTYSFRCANGDVVSVDATDEQAARTQAMEKRWGLAVLNKTWVCNTWVGKGLMLIEQFHA
jgi:hypothetical protein